MKCSNCGSILPAGDDFCMVCGTVNKAVNQQETKSINDILFNMDRYSETPFGDIHAKRKKEKNMQRTHILLIGAAILVVGVFLYFFFGVSHRGTYVLDSMESYGQRVTIEEMINAGLDISLEMKFSGKKAYISMNYDSYLLDGNGYFKVSYFGNKVTLKNKCGDKYEGKFKGNKFILELRGVKYIFVKK